MQVTLRHVQRDATLLDGTCCVLLHTLFHDVACCLKPVKLLSTCKRTQHCWELLRPFARRFKGRYTLGDKLQQQVAATDHSVCSGSATSWSNMLRRHIAATNRFVCTGEILWKSLSLQQNFVAATSRTNSVRFDFLQHVAATKFCDRDKDYHKISPVHTKRFFAETCRHDMLLQLVA